MAGKVVSTVGDAVVKRAVVTLHGEETYLCQSDANGQFSSEGVEPGRYEVEASHEGFQNRPEPEVSVGPGPASLVLHPVPLALIAGRIVDESGEPVPDAAVEAMQFRYRAGKKQLQSTARARTNDRGEYLIADLTPSRYYVRASDSERDPPIIGDFTDRGPRRLQVYAPAFYPGTRDPNRASMLTVGAGDELQHLDLEIHRESVYFIRGRMAPDIAVGLIRRFDEPAMAYATRSSGTGQFEIWGLTPGAYAVTGTRRRALYAVRKVDILNDDVDGIDPTNPTTIVVTGNLRTGGVKGLRVILQSEEAAALDIDAPVQADGSFNVNAQPDNYVVHLQGDGVWLKSMRIGDREVRDHRLVPGRIPGAVDARSFHRNERPTCGGSQCHTAPDSPPPTGAAHSSLRASFPETIDCSPSPVPRPGRPWTRNSVSPSKTKAPVCRCRRRQRRGSTRRHSNEMSARVTPRQFPESN